MKLLILIAIAVGLCYGAEEQKIKAAEASVAPVVPIEHVNDYNDARAEVAESEVAHQAAIAKRDKAVSTIWSDCNPKPESGEKYSPTLDGKHFKCVPAAKASTDKMPK